MRAGRRRARAALLGAWHNVFLIHCAALLCFRSLALQRCTLSDISNTAPLYLGSPLRRTTTALPGQLLGEGERHKHAPLSPLERHAIVALKADGQSTAVVAAKLQTTPPTVLRVMRKLDMTGDTQDAARSGRPKKLKAGPVAAIKHHATSAPHESTPKQLRRLLDLDCSARTIRRTLDDLSLFGRVARYTPPLNEVHRRKRLSFCDGYGSWTQEQWARVLWSDEASVECGPHGQRWVQRPLNTEWDPRYTVGRKKHADKVHIWGCISESGVGRCFIFTENLDKFLMRRILQNNLLQTAREHWPEGGLWWFQQDNDPKHKSKVVSKWLHTHGINTLEWPPYSPDLNPIEHVWTDVKRRVEAMAPANVEEMKETLQAAWDATEPALCEKLVRSMPSRMAAARKHGGWMSGY